MSDVTSTPDLIASAAALTGAIAPAGATDPAPSVPPAPTPKSTFIEAAMATDSYLRDEFILKQKQLRWIEGNRDRELEILDKAQHATRSMMESYFNSVASTYRAELEKLESHMRFLGISLPELESSK